MSLPSHFLRQHGYKYKWHSEKKMLEKYNVLNGVRNAESLDPALISN